MISKNVTIKDAQQQLLELLKFTLEGNEVIIFYKKKPLAKLVPIATGGKARIPGLSQGKIWLSDDFDDPLSDDFWLGQN